MNIIYTTNGIILPQIPKQIQRKSPPPPIHKQIAHMLFHYQCLIVVVAVVHYLVVEIIYLFINKYVLAYKLQ